MHPQALRDALHRPGLAEVDLQQLEQVGPIRDAPQTSAREGAGPILVQEIRDRRQSRGLPAHRLPEPPSASADGQRLLCGPRQVGDTGTAADADPHPPRPWRDTTVLEKPENAFSLTKNRQAAPTPVRAPQETLPHRSPPLLDKQPGQCRREPGDSGTIALEADDAPLMAAVGSDHRPPRRRRKACEDENPGLIGQSHPLRDLTCQEMPG